MQSILQNQSPYVTGAAKIFNMYLEDQTVNYKFLKEHEYDKFNFVLQGLSFPPQNDTIT